MSTRTRAGESVRGSVLVGGFQLLLLLFLAIPLAELFLLIEVGSHIGALATIGLCIGTALLGATLVRSQGLATLRKVQESLNRQEVPAVAMLEGAFLLVAGFCLMTPGLITDTIGFLCLIPPLRLTLIEKSFVRNLRTADSNRPHTGSAFPPSEPARPKQGQIIDGEYCRKDD